MIEYVYIPDCFISDEGYVVKYTSGNIKHYQWNTFPKTAQNFCNKAYRHEDDQHNILYYNPYYYTIVAAKQLLWRLSHDNNIH